LHKSTARLKKSTLPYDAEKQLFGTRFSSEPDLEWTFPKNSRRTGRYIFPKETYNSRLTIQIVQPTDEGNYTCSARNTMGTNEHAMRIIVEGWWIVISL